MNEATLRRRHGKLGLILAVLLGLQAATGLCISLGDLFEAPSPAVEQASASDEILSALHRGGGTAGNVYRVLLGAAVLCQIGLGGLISLRIRARSRRS
jgi:hypothetical protein